MRIQCTCGAKFSFEVTPEMKDKPVRFVCPSCGLDASEIINRLIEAELSGKSTAAGAILGEIPKPTLTESPQAAPVVRVAAPAMCIKHGEQIVAKCHICGKGICPKCMEVFGYLCSPVCKVKARSHGIEVPVFEGQRSVVEQKFWRRTALAGWVFGGAAILGLAFWIWYAWFGSQPGSAFSLRFEQPVYSGESYVVGKDDIVFLHGGTLARYHLKNRKPAWSLDLIDHQKIEADAALELRNSEAAAAKAKMEGVEDVPEVSALDELVKRLERRAAALLELRVVGQNIWVAHLGKLVLYDWNTGKPKKEIPIAGGFSDMLARGDEVWMLEKIGITPVLTKVNLKTGAAQTQEIGAPAGSVLASSTDQDPANTQLSGLPSGTPGRDLGKPMDPGKVAQQVQSLSTPARLALPALLANTLNQERMLEELKNPETSKRFAAKPGEIIQLVPSPHGFIQFSVQLLQENIVEVSAMSPDADMSALRGPSSLPNNTALANQMLNQIQRSRGGDIVREDRSTYLVTIGQPGAPDAEAWKSELIGLPKIYPLKTVTILTAGKFMQVLDNKNQKIWQAQLKHPVYGGIGSLQEGASPYGRAPCMEHDKTLFVCDAGELTAFDLYTGTVRWRIPAPGIAGLFVDPQGMLYVNVSSEGLQHLRYSRDISLWQKIGPMVLKIHPGTGQTLWKAEPGGMLEYVSGDFLYTVAVHNPDLDDPDYSYRRETGYEKAPFLKIRRLDPSNGRVLWTHSQARAPLDIRFDQNRIALVFKKEVQVLNYFHF